MGDFILSWAGILTNCRIELRRNTFGGTLPDEIITVFDLLDRDDRVRVVVLTADPKAPAFCSGVS